MATVYAGARGKAEMGAAVDKGDELGATVDTDLYGLLTFEHVRHHVSQFLQVIQDCVVG